MIQASVHSELRIAHYCSRTSASGGLQMQQSVKVWDIFVRLFHWSLVIFFALAYLTGEGDLERMHALIGYLIAGLIGLRLIWGVIGTKYARFSNFTCRPSVLQASLQSLLTRHPKHSHRHHPAG